MKPPEWEARLREVLPPMQKTTALLIALSVLLTATTAVTSTGALDDTTSFSVGDDTYYLTSSGSLYQEANDCPDLQEIISDCDGDGDDEPADEKLGP